MDGEQCHAYPNIDIFQAQGGQPVSQQLQSGGADSWEFELPGDRAMIPREGNIVELLAEWRKEAPLGPEDQFPVIEDMPAQPEDIF